MEYALVFLLSVIGSSIQTITGFGMGMFILSFYPLFMPAFSASALSTIPNPLLTMIVGWKYRKKINYRLAAIPLLFFTAANVIAISYSATAADGFLKRLLGGFLICLSLYFVFFNNKFQIKPNFFTGALAGLIGGTLSGLFGLGGPPMVLYMLSCTKDNEEYMGTMQFYFFFTSITSIIIRAMHGAYTVQILQMGIVSIVAVFVGIAIGSVIFKKISAPTLRKLVYGFMALTGLIMLIRGA